MQLYAKTDQSVGFMVAVVMEDDSILMFGSNGETSQMLIQQSHAPHHSSRGVGAGGGAWDHHYPPVPRLAC